jgi:chromosome segregation ATPase
MDSSMGRSKSKTDTMTEGERHVKQLEEAKYAALSQQAALEARLAELIALGGDNREEINRVIQAKWQAASDASRLGLEIAESQQGKNYNFFLKSQQDIATEQERRAKERHDELMALAGVNAETLGKLETEHQHLAGVVSGIGETLGETRNDVRLLNEDVRAVKARMTEIEARQDVLQHEHRQLVTRLKRDTHLLKIISEESDGAE